MHITDIEACSCWNKVFTKVLAVQEKEKWRKYLAFLHAQRKECTLVVHTIASIAGRKAKSAENRLASVLAKKWKREYSEIMFYVRVRMALAVVKTNSLLI